MPDQEQTSGQPIQNNPAGRVLWFLRGVEQRGQGRPNESVAKSAADTLGVGLWTTRFYQGLLDLRLEAESVPDSLSSYADTPGHKAVFKHYEEISAAIQAIQTQVNAPNSVVLQLSNGAWASIEYADDVLRRVSSEKNLTTRQAAEHLGAIQSLIRDVVADDTLSAPDKTEVLRLLRGVEDALLSIQVRGVRPVEEASLAVIGSMAVKQDLWDRLASKKWVKRLGHTVVVLLMALDSAGGLQALGFEPGAHDQPRAEIVIVHSDGKKVIGPSRDDEQNIVDAEVVEGEGQDSGS